MKLLSQTSREYKGKEYKKYWVILPSKVVKKLGWSSGEELAFKTKSKNLVISKG